MEPGDIRGHEVVGADGEVIGTVSDVFYDDHVDRPKWLVVDPGLLRKERLVPIEGSYESDDGRLVLPYDKKWVKDGPTVSSDHYPDPATTQLAERHYHDVP
jgi:sporulation protein YlmC with PRC-barrel domain